MGSELEAYHELCGYTLTHGDAAFIHQHVVDAHAAQCAGPGGKPIGLAFALAGLYLHVEKQFTGRQVQLAHMKLAKQKRAWQAFALPSHRGALTALDVMAAPPGPARDAAIDAWCRDVWEAFAETRPAVDALLRESGVL